MTTNTKTTNAAKTNAAKTAQVIVIAETYRARMQDHREKAVTPSKLIKNAVATAHEGADQFARKYAAAVDAVFSTKNAEQMKMAIDYICSRYKTETKGAPRKGFKAETWVHEYFEKLIKANATTCAACRNYLIQERAAEQTAKTAAK